MSDREDIKKEGFSCATVELAGQRFICLLVGTTTYIIGPETTEKLIESLQRELVGLNDLTSTTITQGSA